MINNIINSLEEIKILLNELTIQEYQSECQFLSKATVGQHTRHIIELFQCLNNGYSSAIVDYDDRKRNKAIETDSDFAIDQLTSIQASIRKEDKNLKVVFHSNDGTSQIESSYYRELLYNYEHCIHHQALIKVAVLQWPHVALSDQFGIAPSTMKFRQEQVATVENR